MYYHTISFIILVYIEIDISILSKESDTYKIGDVTVYHPLESACKPMPILWF